MTTSRISFVAGNATARMVGLAAMCALCLAAPGCYNAESLITKAKSQAEHSQHEVVVLGEYYVSLPRAADRTTSVSLEMQVFANVTKSDVEKVTEQLEEFEHTLRHNTILAIRNTAPQELADPTFLVLRKRVTKVTTEILADAPIDSIGFSQFAVYEL